MTTAANVNPTDDSVRHIPGTSVPTTPVPEEFKPYQNAMQQLFDAQHVRAEALFIRGGEKFQLMLNDANKFGIKEGLIIGGVVAITVVATLGVQKLLVGEEVAS